jgi:hypothetical protein
MSSMTRRSECESSLQRTPTLHSNGREVRAKVRLAAIHHPDTSSWDIRREACHLYHIRRKIKQLFMCPIDLLLRRSPITCSGPHLAKHPPNGRPALIPSITPWIIQTNSHILISRPFCPTSDIIANGDLSLSLPGWRDILCPRLLPVCKQDPPPRHVNRLLCNEVVSSPRVPLQQIQELEVVVYCVVACDIRAF